MDVPSDSHRKPWRPLTQRLKIHAALLGSYWFLIILRMVSLGLFLGWRINHPNDDAIWIYNTSVVCETWFAFTWLLDQLPKLFPVNRSADLEVLKQIFETPNFSNPTGKSDLPGIDVFVSTADPEKEPPLVTANTILSILAADYPVEKLSCYVSDDGGSLVTFEAMAEAAKFAEIWVPFCRKHEIEPRNPEAYFNMKRDPKMTKVRQDFVREHRRLKHEYNEFKVRINALPYIIQRRSDICNSEEESKVIKYYYNEHEGDEPQESLIPLEKATWMVVDESLLSPWPGTWIGPVAEHSRGDHASIIQVLLEAPANEWVQGTASVIGNPIDFSEVDTRLPMLVYVSREKRPGYDHNKKAGAMNALLRASAILSNGPFILNLDCDHYIYNSQAMREGMCFMMDSEGDKICYVQFPQRFEGIDPSDRYANHNTVFFDINMRALDGLQGPVYVGTGCLFRRIALYGFDPPIIAEDKRIEHTNNDQETINHDIFSKIFGHSGSFVDSILEAEFQGRLLDDLPDVEDTRAPGSLSSISRQPVDANRIEGAINAISCWYEDKTEWGQKFGWIYGSVTEDVVTGYKMHNRGWQSVYHVSEHGDAFRGTAPINLTDRLHQVLRWATGSVEIFFSSNNAFLSGPRMKFLQKVAYLNVGLYPFTSIFLIVYCFLPAVSLLSGQFIVQTIDIEFLLYLLVIATTHSMLALLEIKWAGIKLEEWWRNEQFWMIGGTSSHISAVLQGLLKVIAGIEISFTLTSKSASDDEDDEFADLYTIKWSLLMIPPITIIITNLIAIAVGVCRTIYGVNPQWGQLTGGVFFSFWVLAHLYPFAKGLMGRHEKTPTVVYVWSGLVAISICLLWVVINRTHDI